MSAEKTLGVLFAVTLGCTLAASCSSGGSGPATVGGGGTTSTGGGSTSTGGSTGTTGGSTGTTGGSIGGNDTGIVGTVAAPAPATFGSAAAQLAIAGGPSFDGTSGSFPANVIFPMLVSSLQQSSTGLSVVTGNQGATATVINSNTVQLTIPSLGVNFTATSGADLVSNTGSFSAGLSYAVMGTWQQGQGTNMQSVTPYVFGYETPQSAVPTSGTAVFSGVGLVTANIYKTTGTDIQSGYAEGNASLSVNFGSGSVAGSFTNFQLFSGGAWNDVSVTASIAPGTNRFSGSTAATSAPAGAMSLSGTATGHIDGAFYGPAAQNLGAIWSLSDGTGSAFGTVVVGH